MVKGKDYDSKIEKQKRERQKDDKEKVIHKKDM